MSYHKVQELAKRFQNKEPLTSQAQDSNKWSEERLHSKLRTLVGEMSGDLLTLRYRNFDPKAFHIFKKIYQEVMSLAKEIEGAGVGMVARRLVNLALDYPNAEIIKNLDLLAKQHIANTNEDFKETAALSHPQINSLDNLIRLAEEMKLSLTQKYAI